MQRPDEKMKKKRLAIPDIEDLQRVNVPTQKTY